MRLAASVTAVALLIVLLGSAVGLPRAAASAPNQSTCDDLSLTRLVEPRQVLVGDPVRVTVGADSADCATRSQPTDVVFIVDRTKTMAEEYIEVTRDALTAFARRGSYADGATRIGVIEAGETARTLAPISSELDRIEQGITRVRGNRNERTHNGLFDAFDSADSMLRDEERDRYVVFLVALDPDDYDHQTFDGRIERLAQHTRSMRDKGINIVVLMYPPGVVIWWYDAASLCEWERCPEWAEPGGGQAPTWAWVIDAEPLERDTHHEVMAHIGNLLPNKMLYQPGIVRVRHKEHLSQGASLDPTSLDPEPDLTDPTLPRWDFNQLPQTGVSLTFEVDMEQQDEPYPVSVTSTMRIDLNSGDVITQTFEPQPVAVLSELPTVTPTSAATPTDAPTPTDEPTDVPPTPTATATPESDEHTIALPLVLRGFEW